MQLQQLRSEINSVNEQIILLIKERSYYSQKVKINKDTKILRFYSELLLDLCPKEGKESSKALDLKLLELCNKRINLLGKRVAKAKLKENPSLLEVKTKEEIEKAVTDPEREKEVISKILKSAEEIGISNLPAIEKFFKKLISLTTNTQIDYIKTISR